MVKYIRLSDNFYPLSEREIKAAFPLTSFPTPFRKAGYEVVFPAPKPTLTSLQIAIESDPELTTLGTYQQTWDIVDKFSTYTDDEGVEHTKEEQETVFLAQELRTAKTNKQTANKAACTAFILSFYPEAIQRSAALGVYPPTTVSAMADHIALIIAEENRVFDLLEAASTIELLNAVEDPAWPEVVA